jgi:phage-related minor tail protein
MNARFGRTLSRRALLAAVPLSLLAATAGTCTSQIPPASLAASVAAVQGLIDDVRALAAGAGLAPEQLAAVQGQIAALQGVVAGLQGATSGTSLSAALATVTDILRQIGVYLPAVLAIIRPAASPQGTAEAPPVAALRAHYAALRQLAN